MHPPTGHLPLDHRFLLRHSYYSLVLASFLACAILAGRIYLSHSLGYTHMLWNLFLAWLPYLFSIWATLIDERSPGGSWRLLPPGLLWLAFFPNAPYMGTEFVHLLHVPSLAVWYDIGLIFAFAWAGIILAVASLMAMQTIAARRIGVASSWVFVCAAIWLSGLGVYLGRFRRWNSWDLVLNPAGVMADVAARLAHPLAHLQTFGVTFVFAALLFVAYLTFACERAAGRSVAYTETPSDG